MVHVYSEAKDIKFRSGAQEEMNEVHTTKGSLEAYSRSWNWGYEIGGFNAYVLGHAPFELDDIYVPTFGSLDDESYIWYLIMVNL